VTYPEDDRARPDSCGFARRAAVSERRSSPSSGLSRRRLAARFPAAYLLPVSVSPGAAFSIAVFPIRDRYQRRWTGHGEAVQRIPPRSGVQAPRHQPPCPLQRDGLRQRGEYPRLENGTANVGDQFLGLPVSTGGNQGCSGMDEDAVAVGRVWQGTADLRSLCEEGARPRVVTASRERVVRE
jgi:hypothetical protein